MEQEIQTRNKYFHIYSDGKFVKEISYKEFSKRLRMNRRFTLASVLFNGDLCLFESGRAICISKKQLEEILRISGKYGLASAEN